MNKVWNRKGSGDTPELFLFSFIKKIILRFVQ
jgi:hypothetical protein